jgi:hypothetical protein
MIRIVLGAVNQINQQPGSSVAQKLQPQPAPEPPRIPDMLVSRRGRFDP